jgi:hypothetical protein
MENPTYTSPLLVPITAPLFIHITAVYFSSVFANHFESWEKTGNEDRAKLSVGGREVWGGETHQGEKKEKKRGEVGIELDNSDHKSVFLLLGPSSTGEVNNFKPI